MNRTERLATLHAEMEGNIEEVVRFERYYARRLRATSEARRPNDADLSVAQADIFHELQKAPCPERWLRERLGLDPGYLWRSLRWLELTGNIAISVAPTDRRARWVSLTKRGERSARTLEQERAKRARETLEQLPRRQQRRLTRAMAVIVEILERDLVTNIVETALERARR
jgi:DNA-binding MarR family transcriptional regulator